MTSRTDSERARIEREAAEPVSQEFPVPSQYQERESAETGEQAAREAVDAASVEREAAVACAAVSALKKAKAVDAVLA